MEYTRKVAPTDGPVPAPGGERNMEFGSVFLLDKSKDAEGATVAPTANGEAPAPVSLVYAYSVLQAQWNLELLSVQSGYNISFAVWSGIFVSSGAQISSKVCVFKV